MLEKIKFTNHLNESMQWGSGGIYVKYNDLHDYAWDYSTDNDKISYFTRGIVKKTVPLVICCASEQDGLTIKNRLLELAEKDVLAKQYGKISIGDYFMRCYITGSAKSNYLYHKGYLETSLTIASDCPQWTRETTTSFRINGTSSGENGTVTLAKRNFDYNADYPYDYANGMQRNTLNNTGFVGTDFKLIVYGAAVNPAIFIAGHLYQVNCTVESGEYLTIDSIQKTVVLTRNNGMTVNLFNERNRASYIFEKIPAGVNAVSWGGDYGFDVILIEERSEPKWT